MLFLACLLPARSVCLRSCARTWQAALAGGVSRASRVLACPLGLRGLDCDQERGPCRSRVVPSDQREQGPTLKAPRAAGLQVLSVRRRVTVAAIKPPNSWSLRGSEAYWGKIGVGRRVE